ncbi:N-acetyltransferase [Pilimelia anulata]|uniref:N-acetyltransferase n=1 Tax=Pilimelia anulata TaxID=53371 RepID=A0A8J3B3W9_9ACTN|nr:GNAT family N-acetyltransferase [Pilimelia anulata]GGJ92580.1 N-acetyltransferase [Pilimelia anulata]
MDIGDVVVRAARVSDVPELVRLSGIMYAEAPCHGSAAPGPWQQAAAATLRRVLAGPDPDWAIAVVDGDRPGELASCAMGAIEHRIASPRVPDGRAGHIFNVATDPGHRERGYARACVEAILRWHRGRGAHRVDLIATPAAAPMYRTIGFDPEIGGEALRWYADTPLPSADD